MAKPKPLTSAWKLNSAATRVLCQSNGVFSFPWQNGGTTLSTTRPSGLHPCEAVYGYAPPTLLSYILGTSANQAVDSLLRDRTSLIFLLKEHLTLAQNCIKVQADKHHSERHFEIGDWVYLRLQPYRQKSLPLCRNLKHSPRFFGLFQIISRIGQVAYKLDLPTKARIHPVFHVSCLKKKLGQVVSPLSFLPSVDIQGEIWPEPELIVDRCMVKRRGRAATEVLICWRGAFPEDDSWELLWKRQT
jgi:hypothetical protein